MSDLTPNVLQFLAGLDLTSPKLLVQPGSMIECLNYEITDTAGYKRIDGFTKYDGHVSLKDVPNARVYRAILEEGTPMPDIGGEGVEDSYGNLIGYLFSVNPAPGEFEEVTYITFDGSKSLTGFTENSGHPFSTDKTAVLEATVSQQELIDMENYLRNKVSSTLPATPIGLHWYDERLWAVVPRTMIRYAGSDNNQTVSYELNQTVTSSNGGTGSLLEKIVTQTAGPSRPEQGYLIIGGMSGDWSPTATLTGAVTVGAGTVNQLAGTLSGMDSTVASLWFANRPATYTGISKLYSDPGWTQVGVLNTFTATVALTGVFDPDDLPTIRSNATDTEATFYFSDGTDTYTGILVDYSVVSGSFDDGDAVIRMQLMMTTGDLTTAFTMYTDVGLTDEVGDVTVRMAYNYLPGFPQLRDNTSRYQFLTANFYGSEGMSLMYGVNGAGRAFAFDGTYLSFIHTQDGATLDMPRHIENHHLHLALGFINGSVQLSVGGQPTNFSGLQGASEIAFGDRVTGLMELEGTTLAVFCEQSIGAIVGTTVDDFQSQTLCPNTGCIEYTLANCGKPVYMDNLGISTLSTSARYGDFVGNRLSYPVSPWLRPRLSSSLIAINNSAGVACAVPVRGKNQYRVFFNDGNILTMTFMVRDGEEAVGFTTQKYYLNMPNIGAPNYEFIPVCYTSEVDRYGVERIYMAHYNAESPVQSFHVYSMDTGISFDGKYIPHYFDTNWFFGSNPSQAFTLHGIRMHGLSKGVANLDVFIAGQQEDFEFSGALLSSTAADISLPRNPGPIYNDVKFVTNRTDLSGRGLSVRLRFSGANTDLALPEPYHVCQVLITYTSPDGAFDL